MITSFWQEFAVVFERIVLAVEKVLDVPPYESLRPCPKAEAKEERKDDEAHQSEFHLLFGALRFVLQAVESGHDIGVLRVATLIRERQDRASSDAKDV